MKRLNRAPIGAWFLLCLVPGIAGCPANDPEVAPAGTARVDGQFTVDGVGLAGVTISFRDTVDMTVKNVVTQKDGLYTATLGAPGSWIGSARYSLGDCPARSVSTEEYDELSVDFPCVSRDVDVGVTYTPVENDCGQPTRSPFVVQGLATTEIAEDLLQLAFTFNDGPEPIAVAGILDLESGTYTGETPVIAFEGGSGKEVWQLVREADTTFAGMIEAQYTFVNPMNSDDILECTEDLNVAVEPLCGNSAPDTGEECDDGNRESGDGCSSVCEVES